MNNAKPIIVYWLSVLIFYIISFFDFFSWKTTFIILWGTFLILNILMGFFNELKKIYVGMIIVELQFIICAAININTFITREVPFEPTVIENIAGYSNLMLGCFDEPNIWKALITMLLPLSTLLGVGLKKLIKHNKMVNKSVNNRKHLPLDEYSTSTDY